MDQTVRFYNLSQSANCTYSNCGPNGCSSSNCVYWVNPPFENVHFPPSSCDLASTGSGSCELALNITNWFAGSTFPAGWNSAPTLLKIKFSSTCTGSAVPSALITCEGSCTTTAKSGCCILSQAFVAPTGVGSCPAGYKLQTINSTVTDFLFNSSQPSTRSKDSTLINLMNLIGSRNFKFSFNGVTAAGETPFVTPDTSDLTRSFCLIDGSAFDTNTQAWADASVTDNCPYPPVTTSGNGTRACPQFLTGSTSQITGCTTACLTPPTVTTCLASGCPLPPTPPPLIDASSTLSPALALITALAFLLF